ncbi:MAG: tRNA (adenosine(37)-N6)-dimethylallyltransferase MiaA [bacterium]
MKTKILIILGPTATGKTKLAVKLAQKFNGEIVSADSRQVYKGMDIGSGKDLKEYGKIKYHLIDVVSPNTNFNVAKFQKFAYTAIDDIIKRKKLPIIVGGTGLYISAIVDGFVFPNQNTCKVRKNNYNPTLPLTPSAEGVRGRVILAQSNNNFSISSKITTTSPDQIRKKLNKLSPNQLLARLKKIDPKTYETTDIKNRRRVQRALEIYYLSGKPKSQQEKPNPRYDCLQIGINIPKEVIHKKIDKRLEQRLRGGAMTREVKNLHCKQKVRWKKLESFGLEYKWVSLYLQKKINYQEMKENLAREIKQFSKRQMTWFKRDERIVWESDVKGIKTLINDFL